MNENVVKISTYGEIEQPALEQLIRCTQSGSAIAAALMADHHVGYSQPIGGVVAYESHISPSGVGYDIACGNKAVMTNLLADDVEIAPIMDEICKRISFGMGRNNNEPVDHEIFDQIKQADFAPQRQLYDLAVKQLGTVGSGNHYVDLFKDDNKGNLWIGVHFGSRGFGHKTASGFLALSQGKKWGEAAQEGEMHSPPVLLSTEDDLGQAYIEAMHLAGDYAYAGRDVVVDKVLEILGAESIYSVHNHHNFAWREKHYGKYVWVIRKGCTPAFPGEEGFVGASMGDESVILEGLDTYSAKEAMHSTVHGAGRVMSRTQAAGRMGTVAECTDRNCSNFVSWREYQSKKPENERFTLCEDHPTGKMKKQRRRIKDGLIDFEQVKRDIADKGIELRGAGADEAPAVYKKLDEVLLAHSDQIKIKYRLKPLGVAMAGADVFDQYKD